MNKEIFLNPETEYHRQLEIEKLFDKEIEIEEAVLLNSCLSKDLNTIQEIGLALKTTDDLNIARFLHLLVDPDEESPKKNLALKIAGDINIQETIDRIADKMQGNLSEVEDIVYTKLFIWDFITPS